MKLKTLLLELLAFTFMLGALLTSVIFCFFSPAPQLKIFALIAAILSIFCWTQIETLKNYIFYILEDELNEEVDL